MATLRRVLFSLLFLLSAGARPSVAQAITPPGGATNAGGQVIVTTNYLYYNKMRFAGTWIGTTTYSVQDVVSFYGATYVSLIAANLNLQPNLNAGAWTALGGAVSTDSGVANAPLLPKFRLAIAKTRDRQSDTKILTIGDSTTNGAGCTLYLSYITSCAWPQRVHIGTDAGMLTLPGLAVAQFPVAPQDLRFTYGYLWQGNTGGFANLSAVNLPGSGNLVFCPNASGTSYLYNSFRVYWLGSTGATSTFVATATGGSPVTVPVTPFAPGVYSSTIPGATTPASAICLTIAAGILNVNILAIEPFNSSTSSVLIGNAGTGGSTTAASSWTAPAPYGSLPAIAAYAPDLCLISLGINDAKLPTPVAAVIANLTTLINTCQVSGDVVLMSMFPGAYPSVPYPNVYPAQQTYVPAYQLLAKTLGIPFLDIFARFGGVHAAAFSFDDLHPNSVGYWDWGAAVSSFLDNVISGSINH